MRLCYSRASAPSAFRIADEDDDIEIVRSSEGDVNWGRERANTILNSNIENCTNKRTMRELFMEHGVPMPRPVTDIPFMGMPYSIATGELFKYLIGRPDKHSKGRGYWLCRTPEDVSKALRGTRKKRAATHFMEYIDNAEHEYRVHIFKGKSIRISEKEFYGRDGNHKLYTTIKPTGEIKHVRKAAKKAVKALGLDFGAVDVLEKDGQAYVLEVNAAPSLGGTLPELYAKTFKEWYEEYAY
jgi:glutathione synthase/RimK-type ligase-like ATP-grasp enzyme